MKSTLTISFMGLLVSVMSCGSVWAQAPSKAAPVLNKGTQVHLAAAKAAAYRPGNDLTNLYETVCAPAMSERGPVEPNAAGGRGQGAAPAANRRVPPRSEWYTDPAKVFDNLYWLGSHGDNYSLPKIPGDSTWAVTTSEGIIVIDSGQAYSAKELITDGMKKMGLDPTQIKYLILTHPHGDRYFGSRYLQDTYHPHVLMSEKDWAALEKNTEPSELKPKKDMIATDGMKLTLGDTTLTLYITPGHTPGTTSVLVPLKDGSQRHLGAIWGGINPSFERDGIRYFANWEESFKTWSSSAARFMDIANKAGADTYLTIHPFYDQGLEKFHAVQYRKPGDPHPMVNKDNLMRFLTIIKECTDAQLARITKQSD